MEIFRTSPRVCIREFRNHGLRVPMQVAGFRREFHGHNSRGTVSNISLKEHTGNCYRVALKRAGFCIINPFVPLTPAGRLMLRILHFSIKKHTVRLESIKLAHQLDTLPPLENARHSGENPDFSRFLWLALRANRKNRPPMLKHWKFYYAPVYICESSKIVRISRSHFNFLISTPKDTRVRCVIFIICALEHERKEYF